MCVLIPKSLISISLHVFTWNHTCSIKEKWFDTWQYLMVLWIDSTRALITVDYAILMLSGQPNFTIAPMKYLPSCTRKDNIRAHPPVQSKFQFYIRIMNPIGASQYFQRISWIWVGHAYLLLRCKCECSELLRPSDPCDKYTVYWIKWWDFYIDNLWKF